MSVEIRERISLCHFNRIFFFNFFFFNDTATTEIYTLSLHDALPIWSGAFQGVVIMVVLSPFEVEKIFL